MSACLHLNMRVLSSLFGERIIKRHNGQAHSFEKSFRVHHYVGSWESFVSPGFDARGISSFKERNNQQNLVVDDTTPGYRRYNGTTWISRFAQLVGVERALALTQSARMREELEKMTVLFEQHGVRASSCIVGAQLVGSCVSALRRLLEKKAAGRSRRVGLRKGRQR